MAAQKKLEKDSQYEHLDLDGDGKPDVSKFEFNRNGQDTFSSMYPDFKKQTFMAYGDFALEDSNNTTIFFELHVNFKSKKLLIEVTYIYKVVE